MLVNTVPRLPTGGAGSAITVHCQVRHEPLQVVHGLGYVLESVSINLKKNIL